MTLFKKPKIGHFPRSPSRRNSLSEIAFCKSIPVCQDLQLFIRDINVPLLNPILSW